MIEVQTTKGAKRRAVIVATARDLLVSEGLDQFVLRRIAKRTDMRLGNLQYYFATRDDLLEAIVRDEFSNDLEAMAQAANDDAATELTDVVALLSARWLTDLGSVYLPIGLLALHEPRFASVLAEIYQEFYDVASTPTPHQPRHDCAHCSSRRCSTAHRCRRSPPEIAEQSVPCRER